MGWDLRHEVVRDAGQPAAWRVVAELPGGDLYVVVFTGPDAEHRARGYAEWMNAGALFAPEGERW